MRRQSGRWSLAVATWCALIFATSSTVILPDRFFAWISAHVLTSPGTFEKFRIFWGLSWFAVVKGWHAAEYAILYTFVRTLIDRSRRVRPGSGTALALTLTLCFAISDEYHQTFVPGRGGTWRDVVIDGVGAILAAFGFYWLNRTRPDQGS